MTERENSDEAHRLCRYFVGSELGTKELAAYERAIQRLPLSDLEKRIRTIFLRFPFLLGAMDGGLSIALPKSHLRRRLLLMLAILETSPNYASSFLDKKYSKVYAIFSLTFRMIGSAFQTLIGFLLIQVARIL